MKTLIREIPQEEPEHADLYVHRRDQAVLRLAEYVEQEEFRSVILTCFCGEKIERIPSSEIDYIETVQEKQLVHTAHGTLEVRKRVYELEHLLPSGFIRISKSVTMNMDHVKTYKPMVNGLMAAAFTDSSVVYISRKYLKDVRSQIMEVRNERKSKERTSIQL